MATLPVLEHIGVRFGFQHVVFGSKVSRAQLDCDLKILELGLIAVAGNSSTISPRSEVDSMLDGRLATDLFATFHQTNPVTPFCRHPRGLKTRSVAPDHQNARAEIRHVVVPRAFNSGFPRGPMLSRGN